MKKGTIILKGRYNRRTLLVPTEAKNVYLVDRGADWKPIYMDYITNEDGSETVTSIDFDGGPKLYIGSKVKGMEIAAFHYFEAIDRLNEGKIFIEFV